MLSVTISVPKDYFRERRLSNVLIQFRLVPARVALLTFPNRRNYYLWSHDCNLDGLVTIQERLRWALISDNRVNRVQWTNREGRRSAKLLLSNQRDHFC